VKAVQLANCTQAPTNQGNIPALVAGWGLTNPKDGKLYLHNILKSPYITAEKKS